MSTPAERNLPLSQATPHGAPVPDPPHSRPRRIADLTLTIGFLAAITAPSTAMLFSAADEAEIARTEQRRAAPFPELKFKKIGPIPWLKSYCFEKFPLSFECWYDDRVGFRRPLIRGYNLAKVFGLTVENKLAPGEAAHGSVTVGRDGWLFLAGKNIDRDFRRTDPFSAADLAAWRNYLQERRNWLAEANIGYACLVAPNQQTIYAEFMPRSITRVDGPSRLDQLVAETASEPKLPLIDPRSVLLAGKSNYLTYHQADSHWNDYGALLAYRLVMDEIAKRRTDLQPASLADFDVHVTSVVDVGDLVLMLNTPLEFRNQLVTLQPRTQRTADAEDLVPGPSPRVRKSINYAVPSGRLLVQHDSFMQAMAPFLNEHFREVHYYNGPLTAEMILELRPDFVLEELAERHLMATVPTNPTRMQRPFHDGPATVARDSKSTQTLR